MKSDSASSSHQPADHRGSSSRRADSAEQAPRRRFGAGKLIGLSLALVLMMLLALLMAWQRQQAQRVEQELARLRAAGEPISPADMEKYYQLPEGREDCTRLWLAACAQFDVPAYQTAAANIPIAGSNNSTSPPPPGQAWADLAAVENFLQQYQPAMDQLHDAARRGGAARYPTDYNQGIGMPIPYVQQLRSGARMLQLEALTRAHRGDAHGAALSLRTMWRLGESLENDPLLISQLVRIAIDGMMTGQLETLMATMEFSDDDLRAIQAELRGADFSDGLRRSLRGERALGFHAIQHYDQAEASLGVKPTPLASPLLRMESAFYLEQMAKVIEAADAPLPQTRLGVQKVDAELSELQHRPILRRLGTSMTSMLLPALGSAADASCRAQARAETADAAIAAELFRRSKVRPPESLAELVPEFLPAVPVDPFDGQPLRFIRRGDELLIYSVGYNNADDGGVENEHSGKPDAVFRLPLRAE